MTTYRARRNDVTLLIDKHLNAHRTAGTDGTSRRWIRGLRKTGRLTVQYTARYLLRHLLHRRRGRRGRSSTTCIRRLSGSDVTAGRTAAANYASGPRIVENFLDVAHFPFVHENVLGTPERPEIADYQAVINDQGVEATGVRVYEPDPYGTGQGDWVSYTYRALRPLTAYLLKESTGPRFSILLTITPHEPARSTAWMWMAMNYGHDVPEADLIAWQDRIFGQDRPILESQRPELLPLDLAAELNVRADRAAVMYRRWLRRLGVSFGTA